MAAAEDAYYNWLSGSQMMYGLENGPFWALPLAVLARKREIVHARCTHTLSLEATNAMVYQIIVTFGICHLSTLLLSAFPMPI
jgi:hypothetical protein